MSSAPLTTTPAPLALSRAACILVLGALAAFVVTVLPLPLWYQPTERVFSFGTKPHALVIDYYGRVLVVVAAVAAGYLAGARVRLSERAARLCFAWCALLVALTIALAAFTLWNRPVTPLPLPSRSSSSSSPSSSPSSPSSSPSPPSSSRSPSSSSARSPLPPSSEVPGAR